MRCMRCSSHHESWAARIAPLTVALLLIAQACNLGGPATSGSTSSHPVHQPTSTSPPSSCADRAFAQLSEAQRVGQLFLVGQTSPNLYSAGIAHLVEAAHISGVVLGGTGWDSAAKVQQ